jgi:hypothetical protein
MCVIAGNPTWMLALVSANPGKSDPPEGGVAVGVPVGGGVAVGGGVEVELTVAGGSGVEVGLDVPPNSAMLSTKATGSAVFDHAWKSTPVIAFVAGARVANGMV